MSSLSRVSLFLFLAGFLLVTNVNAQTETISVTASVKSLQEVDFVVVDKQPQFGLQIVYQNLNTRTSVVGGLSVFNSTDTQAPANRIGSIVGVDYRLKHAESSSAKTSLFITGRVANNFLLNGKKLLNFESQLFLRRITERSISFYTVGVDYVIANRSIKDGARLTAAVNRTVFWRNFAFSGEVKSAVGKIGPDLKTTRAVRGLLGVSFNLKDFTLGVNLTATKAAGQPGGLANGFSLRKEF